MSPDPRPSTQFIYSPDKWSFIVALIAGTAGVLAHLGQAGRSGWSVHLGDHRSGCRQHRARDRVRRARRDLDQCPQVVGEHRRHGVGRVGALAVQQFIWSRVSMRRAKAMKRTRRML